MNDLAVKTVEEYVNLATFLGTNFDVYMQIRGRFINGFDKSLTARPKECTEEFERAIVQLVGLDTG